MADASVSARAAKIERPRIRYARRNIGAVAVVLMKVDRQGPYKHANPDPTGPVDSAI
jgi:hypothetical protein